MGLSVSGLRAVESVDGGGDQESVVGGRGVTVVRGGEGNGGWVGARGGGRAGYGSVGLLGRCESGGVRLQ